MFSHSSEDPPIPLSYLLPLACVQRAGGNIREFFRSFSPRTLRWFAQGNEDRRKERVTRGG